jgi:hypothetical protein
LIQDDFKEIAYQVRVVEGFDVGGDFTRSSDAGQQNSDGSGSAHIEMQIRKDGLNG